MGYYFDDGDLAFINRINRLFTAGGIIALLLSFILGSAMSKKLSQPISGVVRSARLISRGFFGGRITEKSSTTEIDQLTETINDLAAALEKQEILRKQLTADVAHELRTPLAAIQGHLEAMIDGIWEADTERLEGCHEEILRINKMVGDLEELARYDREVLGLNREKFDISQLIQGIIKNYHTGPGNEDVDIEFFGEGQIVHADRQDGPGNYKSLSNAVQHTPKGGSPVEVEVKGYPEVAKIVIRDAGEGCPRGSAPYI